MSAIKKVFDFYINSSIHVALAVISLTAVTYIEFEIQYDKNVLSFIGLGTVTGYNFVKYFGIAKFHHRSLSKELKSIQVFSLICFAVMCFFLSKLNTDSYMAILIFAGVTFLYAIPLLPNRIFIDQKQKLRSIGGLKIYIIALVWSGVTVLLPLINANIELHNDTFLSALQRFIFVIVLMLPFEIRDLNYDSLQLSTIPQKIGVRKTKIIGAVLIVITFFLEFFKNDMNIIHIWSLAIIGIITLIFLIVSSKSQGLYYSSFWVESVPIIWFVLLMFF